MLNLTENKVSGAMGCLLMIVCLFIATQGQENIQFSQGKMDEQFGNALSIPLMNYKGRGIDLPVTLHYSSSLWRLDNLNTIDVGVYQTITQAVYSEHSISGWKTSLDLPEIEWPKDDDIYNSAGRPCGPPVCFSGQLRIRRVTIHMPDGSTHELREDDNAYSGPIDQIGTFYAVDGSRLRYDSVDADTGTLYMPDGTRYVLDAGSGQIIDRNGNAVTYNAGTRQWSDTVGRTIDMPFPASPAPTAYTYSLPGLAGVNGGHQTYTFIWKNLVDALTPGSGNLRVMGTEYLPYPNLPATGPSGNNYFQTQGNYPGGGPYPYDSLFYSDAEEGAATIVVGKGEPHNDLFNPVVLNEIDLPDGRKYIFTYNVYGEMTKITYPTGAFEQFQFGPLGGSYMLNPPYDQAERGISSRTMSENGTGNDLLQWTYSRTQVSSGGFGNGSENAYRYRVVAPDTTCSETYKVKMPAHAHGGMFNHVYWDWNFVNPRNGAAVESRAYGQSATACGGSLLRRDLTAYESSAKPIGTPWANGLQVYAYRNIRPVKKTEVLFEGSGSALGETAKFTYDTDNTTHEYSTGFDKILDQVYKFAIVSNASPSDLAQAGTIDQIDNGNIAKSIETQYSTDELYRGANILGLPVKVLVRSGDIPFNVVSQSQMSYDDIDYVPPSSHRGLPTTMKVWDSSKSSDPENQSAYLVTHAKFDLFGNRIIATDAKGYQSTTTYDSAYYAYPISMTSEIPDPTPNGTPHGSNTAFTTSTNFDPTTGLVLSTTDINGQTTSMSYNDPLLRLKSVTAPNGQQTTTDYGAGNSLSSTRWVKVTTQINATESTDATSFYDGLGRTYLTDKKNIADPDGHAYSYTCYDNMGRVLQTSNPFRNYLGQDYCHSPNNLQWTIPEYDGLGRTKKITMPAPTASPLASPDTVNIAYGISTTTDFFGTTKTITDEAGKQRTGITDALGNMIRVIEDPTGVNLATDYTFDSLGNLRQTAQGSQNRYFAYDSLSRIIYGKQVEQDTNPSLNYADPFRGHNGWSVKYTYDDNSNILSTTNARNQTITATYDRLDRLVIRDYGDTTPDVDFYYDGKGLTSPAAYVNGKTTKVSNMVSNTKYTNFDNMGRTLSSEQITSGQTYPFSYTYNLAGALVTETYPSGRVVKNTVDTDGKLEQVQSQKNSASGFFTYADAFRYDAAGAVTKMQLGNGHWETTSYNERRQVTQIGLGTLDNQQDVLKLEFGYTGPTSAPVDRNNGSMRTQKITVPDPPCAVGVACDPTGFAFTAQQTYTYDSLNRIKIAEEKISEATSWKQTFLYDRFGNRSFDSANTTTLGSCASAICNPTYSIVSGSADNNRFALNQGSGYTYEYDQDGSITKDALGQKFSYDGEGRENAFFAVGNNTTTPNQNYGFDGEGKRVTKSDGGLNGNATIFVYDAGGNLIGEYESCTICELAEPRVSYMTTDHLGSPRIITDANGAVVSRKDFTAFGENVTSPERVGGSSGNGYDEPDVRQDYTGYQKDEESGLEYSRARYYNPKHGRFTSADPLLNSLNPVNPQTLNRYSYALNIPHRLLDPTGLFVWSEQLGGNQTDKQLRDAAGTDKVKRKAADEIVRERNVFRMGLNDAVAAGARSDDPGAVTRATGAYGSEGKKNGVTVTFGTNGNNTPAQATSTGLAADEKTGVVTAQVLVTIDEKQSHNRYDLAIYIAHEGSHVADRQEFAQYFQANLGRMADPDAANQVMGNFFKNLSIYTTETRAYQVAGLIAEGLDAIHGDLPNSSYNGHLVWDRGWAVADRARLRALGADAQVRTSPDTRDRLKDRIFTR
jgi:RHS repeat-associated protein